MIVARSADQDVVASTTGQLVVPVSSEDQSRDVESAVTATVGTAIAAAV
ncbi:MAG: hypothetical protein O3B13_06320 [Planctomycetota bacterium]|nr:hypothetical protein [Planctomycetota bacterium]MDA1162696.1 hypothetical protein [Planctomycetota bacterium]